MRKSILPLLSIIIPYIIFAQNIDKKYNLERKKIDSLKRILTLESSKENYNNYGDIIKQYSRLTQNNDSSLFYADKLLKISKGSDYYYKAVFWKGYALQTQNRYNESIQLLQKVIEEKEKVKDISIRLKLMQSLAEAFFTKKEYEKSMNTYLQTIPLYENGISKDTISFSTALINMGLIQAQLKMFDKAIPYFNRVNKILEIQINNTPKTYRNYRNYIYLQISTLTSLATIYFNSNNTEKALALLLLVEDIALKEEIFQSLPRIYNSLCNYYLTIKEYDKSLLNGLKGLELVKKYNYPNYKFDTFFLLGKNYYEKEEYSKALIYFNKVLLGNMHNVETLKYLANIYQKQNKSNKAFQFLEKYMEKKDSINKINQNEKITEILEKYENEKKQHQIEILNKESALQEVEHGKQTNAFYTGIGFLSLLLIFSLIAYRNYKNKQKLIEATLKLDNALLQQRFLRTQLNPHFFFHALSSIESYIYKDKKVEAANYLQNFSKLMRNVLESSDVDFILLEEDISFIKKYLDLQRLNHEFKFDYTIEIDEEVKAENIMVPPMLIQPFIENAILHGALQVENGRVIIYCLKELDNLIIKISDNGYGVSQASQDSKKLYRSMSTNIVKQRIKNLKKAHNMSVFYEVSNHEQYRTVTFNIPLKTDTSVHKKSV